MTTLMQKEGGGDLVTRYTCTPYGINSHRLLIRGRQVEYHGEDDETEADDSMLKSLRDYYMLYALLAIAVALLLAVIIRLIRSRKILKRPGRKRDE